MKSAENIKEREARADSRKDKKQERNKAEKEEQLMSSQVLR